MSRLAAAVRTVPDFPSPGIQFKDVTPILASPTLLREAADRLAAPWLEAGVTHVVGIESRGYWWGALLAERLGAGFVPARKPGKLPAETLSETYTLEYGTDQLDLHADAFAGLGPPARVLVHDDVIATGGTAAAAVRLVERAGATVAGCSFLVELGFLQGQDRLPSGLRVESVLQY